MIINKNTLRVKAKPYTQEETNTLKNLWLKGLSCTQIAKELKRRVGSVENRVKYLRKTGQLTSKARAA